MVFAFTAAEGTLDLYARLPSSLKPQLECLFAEVLLKYPLEPQSQGRSYDLNRLRDFAGFPLSPEHRVQVRLAQMAACWNPIADGRFYSERAVPTDDISGWSMRSWTKNQWSLEKLSITMATLASNSKDTIRRAA